MVVPGGNVLVWDFYGVAPAGSELSETVEGAFAAQVKLPIHQRGGGAENVVKPVQGEGRVVAVVAQDDGRAVAGGDVDASGGADGRGEDEITDAVEPQRFATRPAGERLQAGKDVLVVAQEIKGVVLE